MGREVKNLYLGNILGSPLPPALLQLVLLGTERCEGGCFCRLKLESLSFSVFAKARVSFTPNRAGDRAGKAPTKTLL